MTANTNHASPRLLGEILTDEGHVTAEDITKALSVQSSLGGRLGNILVRLGAISEETLLDNLSNQLNFAILDKADTLPSANSVKQLANDYDLPLEWLIDNNALCWLVGEKAVGFTARDPLATTSQDALRFFLPDFDIQYFLIRSQDLENLLNELENINQDGWQNDDISSLREMAEEAPVVELVNSLLSQAMEQRASDIHIEPEEKQFIIRFRIDGVLSTKLRLPKEKFNAVASRIKLISDIDIAERRLPQDGRFSTRASGIDVDIRVSTLPGVHGESIVMRLLPKEQKDLLMKNLGMLDDHMQIMRRLIASPHGIVLVTGPTGSGKSTTLYTALDETNDGVKKIITVEDPVEFQLKGITQIQANSDIGFTFARALRSILRQDPDVVMIGEVRDLETAEIAIQASLTGHLVLSTLHTNDAISAFTRLIDMGVEPFLVAEPVIATQAQRLVRKLCVHCSTPQTITGEELKSIQPFVNELFADKKPDWRQPVGCEKCQKTGYSGRVGIYEIIEMTVEMQKLIVGRANISEMYQLAKENGFRTLRQDGLVKAYLGITSIEEVYRVAQVEQMSQLLDETSPSLTS